MAKKKGKKTGLSIRLGDAGAAGEGGGPKGKKSAKEKRMQTTKEMQGASEKMKKNAASASRTVPGRGPAVSGNKRRQQSNQLHTSLADVVRVEDATETDSQPGEQDVLSRLMYPVSRQRFYNTYFEKRPLVVKRSKTYYRQVEREAPSATSGTTGSGAQATKRAQGLKLDYNFEAIMAHLERVEQHQEHIYEGMQ
eukprot:g1592.t1